MAAEESDNTKTWRILLVLLGVAIILFFLNSNDNAAVPLAVAETASSGSIEGMITAVDSLLNQFAV